MTHPSRFDPAKGYSAVRWPQGRKSHSYDLNDHGRLLEHRMRQQSDLYLRDGSVIEGGEIALDLETGLATIAAGRVYVAGHFVEAPERIGVTIATTGAVRVGVELTEETVTYLEDPALKGDIAGTRAFGEPGADRIRVSAAWIVETETFDGEFFGVYTVQDGEVLTPTPPIDPLDSRLARYDREARGHYIVRGWNVRSLGYIDGKQHFTISEGVINVWGYKRERSQAYRLIVTEAADLQNVESEPHVAAGGTEVLTVAHAPIAAVNDVTVMRETTETVTRGGGAADGLPDTSVAAIISVTQGATTYVQGVDYVRNGDTVEWRDTANDEPDGGSSYDVTYQYLDVTVPDSATETTVTVSGAVAGSLIQIDYDWALPRIDVIAVDRDGAVHYVTGEASLYEPIPPRVPLDQLAIATVTNKWGATPIVENIGTRAVHNTRLEVTEETLRDVIDLVAQERLKRDMDARQPTAKRGVFVDPFKSDVQRDQGIGQTAAIVDEVLQLPIATTVIERSLGPDPLSLPWAVNTAIDQPLATDSIRINPYLSFDPLPARVHLDPAVHTWSDFDETWASPETRAIVVAGTRNGLASSVSQAALLGVTSEESETIRPITVLFEIDGFGVGENLESVSFDGVAVTPDVNPATEDPLTGDAEGRLSGVFTIPAGIPTGAKRVEFTGAGGTRGIATFIGSGIVTTAQLRQVTTQTWTVDATPDVNDGNGGPDGGADPVGQTFTLAAAEALTGIRVKFAAIGDAGKGVTAQLREVRDGAITRSVLAEAPIDMSAAALDTWIRAAFPAPVPLIRGVEYAIVFMTDDEDHALRIAGIGHFDAAAQRFVTSQPYLVGVLQSSSNNSSWTVHQNEDLTFQLETARYSATERIVALDDPVTLTGCTDLVVNVGVDEPSPAARVSVRVTRADSSVIYAAPGQRIRFDAAVSENVEVAFVLRGTETESPVLYPWVQIVHGVLAPTGDYVSRAMPAGSPSDPQHVVITYEAQIPSGAAVAVETGQIGDWSTVPLDFSTPLGDGWTEFNHVLDDYEQTDARAKLTLSGTAGARSLVRNLRANVTPDPVNIITGT